MQNPASFALTGVLEFANLAIRADQAASRI